MSETAVTADNPLGIRPNPYAARVTVVERVYYQSEQDPSREISDHAYEVYLKTDEQPWGPRRQAIGSQWTKLDLGYLAGRAVSELVVENLEGTTFRVHPTEEQLAEVAAKVVVLHVSRFTPTSEDDDGVYVRPGRSCRFEPVGDVWARCLGGIAKVKIAAAPGDE